HRSGDSADPRARSRAVPRDACSTPPGPQGASGPGGWPAGHDLRLAFAPGSVLALEQVSHIHSTEASGRLDLLGPERRTKPETSSITRRKSCVSVLRCQG